MAWSQELEKRGKGFHYRNAKKAEHAQMFCLNEEESPEMLDL